MKYGDQSRQFHIRKARIFTSFEHSLMHYRSQMTYLDLILCACGLVPTSNAFYELMGNGDIKKTAKELEKCLPNMSLEDVAKFSVMADSRGMLNPFMNILKRRDNKDWDRVYGNGLFLVV